VRIRVDNVSKGFGGKSTLLNLLAGLLRPDAGTIDFDGPLRTGRPATAMVFQEFALFPWRTAQANVEFGLEEADVPASERHAIARHFIDLTGLGGFETRYPHQLSGGRWPRTRSWTRAFCATHCGRSREGACRMIKGDP
jgi:ABC-type nitrate/sulfonate/bicarbonate transport system ATPase subunit